MKQKPVHSPVDAYIEKAAPFAQPILLHLRALMHQASPAVEECLKWRMPFFVERGIIVANMAAFKHHCSFGFWGPEMKQALTEERLNGGSTMASLDRITDVKNLPSDKLLLTYMRQAISLIQSGERKKSIDRKTRKTRKETPVPVELMRALKKNKAASREFERFSQACRHEYAEWIAEAKRPDTRNNRVSQAVDWIAQGKTRNWKYKS